MPDFESHHPSLPPTPDEGQSGAERNVSLFRVALATLLVAVVGKVHYCPDRKESIAQSQAEAVTRWYEKEKPANFSDRYKSVKYVPAHTKQNVEPASHKEAPIELIKVLEKPQKTEAQIKAEIRILILTDINKLMNTANYFGIRNTNKYSLYLDACEELKSALMGDSEDDVKLALEKMKEGKTVILSASGEDLVIAMQKLKANPDDKESFLEMLDKMDELFGVAKELEKYYE